MTFNLFARPWKRQMFNFMAQGLGFLKVIYSGWVSTAPTTFKLEDELMQY